jgi:hypothetical protein
MTEVRFQARLRFYFRHNFRTDSTIPPAYYRIGKENSSSNIIIIIKTRRMREAGHVERMGEPRNAYRILVGKPDRRRQLGRPRRRWVDNIKMDLREIG